MSLFSFGFKKEPTPNGKSKPPSLTPGDSAKKTTPLLKSISQQVTTKSSSSSSQESKGSERQRVDSSDSDELLSQLCEKVEQGKRVNGPKHRSPPSASKRNQPVRGAARQHKRRKVLDSDDEEQESEDEYVQDDNNHSSSEEEAELMSLVDSEDEDEYVPDGATPKSKQKTLRKKSSTTNGKSKKSSASTNKLSSLSTPPPAKSKANQNASPIASVAPSSPKIGAQSAGDHEHHHLSWLSDSEIRDIKGRKKSDPGYDGSTLLVPKGYLEGKSEFHAPGSNGRKITPSMRFWWGFKEQFFDTILFYKVGKFYEIYHMDADVAVKHLGLMYMKGDTAHCGFPEKAYGKFSEQLVKLGYRVARVEQTETPQAAKERTGKASAPVRREVCGVISRGTRTLDVRDGAYDDDVDSSTQLVSLFEIPSASDATKTDFGVCIMDSTTGRFALGCFKDMANRAKLRMLLARETPAEIVFSPRNFQDASTQMIKQLCPYNPGTRNTVVHTRVAGVAPDVQREATFAIQQLLDARDNAYFEVEDDDGEEQQSSADPYTLLPPFLQRMISADGSVKDNNALPSLAALGLCLRVLQRSKIDRKLVSMGNFASYTLPGEDAVTHFKKEDDQTIDALAGEKLVLDGQALSNLELFISDASDKPSSEDGSLISFLDLCKTKFGKRELRRWVAAPLQSANEIRQRQAKVTALIDLIQTNDVITNIRNTLKTLPDMERMLLRIHTIGVKDPKHPDSRAVLYDFMDYNKSKINSLVLTLRGAGSALKLLEDLHNIVANSDAKMKAKLACLLPLCDLPFEEWAKMLERITVSFDQEAAKRTGAITPRKGASARYDAACERVEEIRNSFEEELERVKDLFQSKAKGKSLSGIKFWHPSTGKDLFQIIVPDDLLPKNGDAPAGLILKSKTKTIRRYHTKAIVARLTKLSEAEAKLESLKADATRLVFEEFDKHREVWTKLVNAVKELDCLISLALVSGNSTEESPMCLPEIVPADTDNAPVLDLVESRHPCVARMLERSGNTFIPNDIHVGGNGKPSCMLLTGPNMGGKSTLLRQTCVAVVLAQIGCYVPAQSARITPVDRIFTRLGASDAIMLGQSTFFVELDETATVLHNATNRSLVILDELGRGTSTHDGAAIAAAVVDKLIQVGARTLFATHYHALVEDFAESPAVQTAHMSCFASDEDNASSSPRASSPDSMPVVDVTFLYKLAEGASDKSHGLNVARLAKLPDEIIKRAHEESVRFEQNFLAQQLFAELEQAIKSNAHEQVLEHLYDRAKALGL